MARVCVVTVTYGSRWHLLKQTLQRVLAHDERIRCVIVVDNASTYSVAQAVEELGSNQILVRRLPENTGSANGFGVGIQAAADRGEEELVWLLDDDNMPAPGALPKLLAAYEMLGRDRRAALLALRPRSREYRLAAQGLMKIEIRRNSFLGFHVGALADKAKRRLLERRLSSNHRDRCPRPLVEVGYAPYGGLLFHRSWVERIGLPRKDYFLYADDYEYTSRIPAAGGSIFLCATAQVDDLDVSWHLRKTRVHHLFESSADLGRLYFSIRNRTHLEVTRFVSSRALYCLHAYLYLGLITIQSLITDLSPLHSGRRLMLIIAAMRDGMAGRLGKDGSVRVSR
jgi:GT2 family glycosyltransferase